MKKSVTVTNEMHDSRSDCAFEVSELDFCSSLNGKSYSKAAAMNKHQL